MAFGFRSQVLERTNGGRRRRKQNTATGRDARRLLRAPGWQSGVVPGLRTERLLLRRWRSDDLDALAAIDGDAEVMRYIGDGSVRDREQTATALANFEQRWAEQGFGLFAAEDRVSGALAGWVGLAVPTFLPEVLPAVEIGWRLARPFWGRGLATEGARAVLEYVFTELDRSHVISLIHPDNAASIAVATRLGETKQGETQVFDIGCLIYGITRERWHELNPR